MPNVWNFPLMQVDAWVMPSCMNSSVSQHPQLLLGAVALDASIFITGVCWGLLNTGHWGRCKLLHFSRFGYPSLTLCPVDYSYIYFPRLPAPASFPQLTLATTLPDFSFFRCLIGPLTGLILFVLLFQRVSSYVARNQWLKETFFFFFFSLKFCFWWEGKRVLKKIYI